MANLIPHIIITTKLTHAVYAIKGMDACKSSHAGVMGGASADITPHPGLTIVHRNTISRAGRPHTQTENINFSFFMSGRNFEANTWVHG